MDSDLTQSYKTFNPYTEFCDVPVIGNFYVSAYDMPSNQYIKVLMCYRRGTLLHADTLQRWAGRIV